MSVKDYIRKHYGPYMCGSDRHKIIISPKNYREGDEITMICVRPNCDLNCKMKSMFPSPLPEVNEVLEDLEWVEANA